MLLSDEVILLTSMLIGLFEDEFFDIACRVRA